MSKKPRKAKSVKAQVSNANLPVVQNGMQEALLGFNPGGMGSQLSQVDTLFYNERWYLISNMRQILSQVYVEHGLIRTIVDVPVDDALRDGYEIKSKQISPEQIEKLLTIVERENINSEIIGQGAKWNRLFGGGGIVIMTDQDPSTPLNVAAIGKDSPLEFRAVDMWELFYSKQNMEGFDQNLRQYDFEFYDYYGVKLHKSRVMKLKGLEAPSFIRPRLRGWGYSIVESLVQSINQFLKSKNLTFEVLDEFKLDIFKIDGMTQTLLSADGTAKVRQRVQLASQQKNYQNALTMDAKDDYVQKQLTFAGLAEMMKEFRIQIASDMRMPMTKLFGLSASGFNSGEDDIENYNAMVMAEVRSKIKFEILHTLELICQKEFGFIPDDLKIEFKPLRVLSAEQEQNVKNAKFQRVVTALEKGICTLQEAKESMNKDGLLPVQVDTTITDLPEQSEPDGEEDTAEEA